MFGAHTHPVPLTSQMDEGLPGRLLLSIISLSRDLIESAKAVSSQKKLAEKLTHQTQQIASALTGYLTGCPDSDVDPTILKDMIQYENELRLNLQDVTKQLNRERRLASQASLRRSPSPEMPRSRSQSPVSGALKRVFNSVAGEFGMARCAERSDHALKVFTAHNVVPPSYDSPLSQLPDQISLTVWPDTRMLRFA